MKFRLRNGEFVEGDSPTEIVENLKNSGRFTAGESVENYMKGFSCRWKKDDGKDVRFDTSEDFVEDLENTGFMEREG